MTKAPKYAPANEAGDKPYVVEWYDWGKKRATIVYSDTVANAKFAALGRSRVGVGVTGCRRATPEQVETFNTHPYKAWTPEELGL